MARRPQNRKIRRKNRKVFTNKMRGRLRFVFICCMVGFGVVGGKAVWINLHSGSKYAQQVLTQQGYSSKVIPYKRGDIVDKNGTLLATDKKVYDLILEPANIVEFDKKKEATVQALKTFFGFTDEEVAGFLANENSYYVVAKKGVEYEEVKKFEDYCDTDEGKNVVGIYYEERYVRVYPNKELACHLLGFTVSGNVGMYGVEEYYNDQLNGTNGRQYSYLNEDNGVTTSIEAATNGYNLVTSIDANVQKIVEEKVKAKLEEEDAKNISVLVMNPKNCQILALYNSHTFDPNDAYDLDSTQYQFDTPEELEAAGYEVDLQYASNDVSTQVSQLENQVANGCDLLVVASIDGSSLGEPLKQAKEAGIPVISYDRLLMNSDAVTYYATFDNYKVGQKQGEYLVDALDLDNQDGPFNIELFTGDPGDNNCNFFFGGAMDVLQKYIDEGKLVVKSGQTEFEQVATANWDSAKAQDRMDTIIAGNYSDGTNLDAVLCSNDSTALGVENALAASYTGEYPIITGQDCDTPNVKNLVAGKQAMSVFKDTRALASAVVKMVDSIMKGEEPEVNDTESYDNGTGIIPTYLCDPVVVTVDNYKEMLIDSGYYTEDQIQ